MHSVLKIVNVLALLAFNNAVSGSVTQCYHCNSLYCGDPYDSRLGAILACSDVFKNTQSYSNRIVVGSGTLGEPEKLQIGANNTEDVELLSSSNGTKIIQGRSSAAIFDIQRKIWELFNKGEIDENTQFVCVKAPYYTENSQVKTYRGCVPKYTKTISSACDFVNQKVSGASTGTIYGCYTCDTNLCNSGVTFGSSLLAMAVAFAMKLIF